VNNFNPEYTFKSRESLQKNHSHFKKQLLLIIKLLAKKSQENAQFLLFLYQTKRNHILFRIFMTSPVGHFFNSWKLIALSQINENKKIFALPRAFALLGLPLCVVVIIS